MLRNKFNTKIRYLIDTIGKRVRNTRIFSPSVQHPIQQYTFDTKPSNRFAIVSNCDSTTTDNEVATSNRTWDGIEYRKDPIVTTIKSELLKTNLTKALHTVRALFKMNNHEVRIAGGAVRDLLLNQKPRDIDMTTTATYAEMMHIFSSPVVENVQIMESDLKKYGTLPLRIFGQRIEVSAMKTYVPPDNKSYDKWLLDAKERDLTINAMYLTFDGKVYDYLNGYDDLKHGRIRFVADIDQLLRDKKQLQIVLRYFRFFDRYANSTDEPDKAIMDAFKANAGNIVPMDAYQFWLQLERVMSGKRGCEMLLKLVECGMGIHFGLSHEVDTTKLMKLIEYSKTMFDGIQIKPATMMCALLNTKEDVKNVTSRLEVPAYDRNMCYFLIKYKHISESIDDLSQYHLLCRGDSDYSFQANKDYILELLKLNGKRQLHDQMLQFQMFESKEHMERFSTNNKRRM